MGSYLKENSYATAAKAEVREVAAGQTPQSPRHPASPRRGLPAVQEPLDGPPRLPAVRHVSQPRSDRAAEPRTGQLATSGAATFPFLAFSEQAARNRALVFPG